MKLHPCMLLSSLVVAAVFGAAGSAEGQLWKKVKETAKRAAERETLREVDRKVTGAVRCAFDDLNCIEAAEREGKEIEVVDPQGNVVSANAAPGAEPGEGAWANYDFIPGERVLFAEDFSRDNVGDFPRRLDFVRGNWDIVELQGQRLLRNTGPRHSALRIPLPETLPERFTIEFPVLLYQGNANLALSVSPPARGAEHQYRIHHYQHNYIDIGSWGTGLTSKDANDPKAKQDVDEALTSALVPVRIMADGRYVKVYVGEQRVANVPNADLARGDTLWIENTYDASETKPIYIGAIRVAAGGADLYDALARDGRVATQGILFATGSDRIQPESTPTLKEITQMLRQHPELRLTIEGHTDSVGDNAANQQLSKKRAEAVRAYLVQQGIGAARLGAKGFGASKPAAPNDTPEGRQQNRRVELVRQ